MDYLDRLPIPWHKNDSCRGQRLAVSPSGNQLVACATEQGPSQGEAMGGLMIWRLDQPNPPELRFQGYSGQLQGVRCVCFLGDESRVVFGGRMGLGLVDIPTSELRFAGGPAVNCLAHYRGSILAMSLENVLCFYDVATQGPLRPCPSEGKAHITSLSLSKTAGLVATGGYDSWIRVYKCAEHKMVARFQVPGAMGLCAAVSPDGSLLAYGACPTDSFGRRPEYHIVVRQTDGRWPILHRIEGLRCSLRDLSFTADGQQLIVVTKAERSPGTLRVLDIHTGRCVQEWSEFVTELGAIAVGTDWVAGLDRQRGQVHLWDA